MSDDHEFKRAIEEIKARTSLEDVVGECVDGALVSRSGRLWACCPFHDESTPSFAIGPDPGLWYCFGACRQGGDLIEFVKRRNNLAFRDAIELLAARSGVSLPERKQGRRKSGGGDAGLAVLERSVEFYASELQGPRGATAREYLARRSLSPETIATFGLGLAPAGGQDLVEQARRGGGSPEPWEATGLIRVADGGRRYDFFRGRLMIPIRDDRGRTVGFGGRRLADADDAGPKYVNTPETDWFKKGSVIYGYERAVDTIRRSGHAILMEGYTDVLAAHQAGLTQACAVLGTATTPQHAQLLRRAGVRRVTLVFDGDEAGRRAAWRALEGLLPLDVDLDVVRPPAGQDPADLLAGGDAQPFLAHLEQAEAWFDYVTMPLGGLRGRELSHAVDDVLALLSAVPKPVHRDALLGELAGRLGLPVESLRMQWQALPERRKVRATDQASGRTSFQGPDSKAGRSESGSMGDESGSPAADGQQGQATDAPAAPLPRKLKNAYMDAVGAALVDTSLIPRIQPLVPVCPHPGLTSIMGALCALWDDEDAELSVDAVMTHLGDDPVRGSVSWLVQHVHNAESPLSLLEGALEVLRNDAYQRRLNAAQSLVAELEREQAVDRVRFLELSSETPLPEPSLAQSASLAGSIIQASDSPDPDFRESTAPDTLGTTDIPASDPTPVSSPPHPSPLPHGMPQRSSPELPAVSDGSAPTLAQALSALTQLLRDGPGTQFPLTTSVGIPLIDRAAHLHLRSQNSAYS